MGPKPLVLAKKNQPPSLQENLIRSYSDPGLDDSFLRRMERAANRRKELMAVLEEIFDEWVAAEAECRFAQMVREARERGLFRSPAVKVESRPALRLEASAAPRQFDVSFSG